ncbi:glycerate kinase [Providencia huaxiensis]|uniref:glycerate kinase n=1 Tax=Providencia TaxID=586 RepID=UPI000EC356E4|nr:MULTISPECIES: glycerate kinase [Providencia]HCI97446.1 glycerate kinase [Providencia sp.]ELR5057408.1 glycerate kinase [Providencia rettgeri]ELR5087004.1 glycerate kinase [Providencia rettgeri]ELR5108080.1 glycerate kinase [Providencia rettgeri]ELR5281796.1 glycerate kinase [Providencia rettgeri]
MKIVIALDSFKGSCSAQLACQAVAEGFERVSSELDVTLLPISDGGEGLLESLEHSPVLLGVTPYTFNCTGPYGSKVDARLLVLEGKTAFIEMAQCCGLELVQAEHRQVEKASTYGLGEMVKHALDLGCTRIIIGIGGSATNDGGAGFAQALGAEFYDNDQQLIEFPINGENLINIAKINFDKFDPRVADVEFNVSCDVENPLLGKNGATYIYGSQKGADKAMLDKLELGMAHYAQLMTKITGKDFSLDAGSGAAGGLGAGLRWFVSAKLEKGIDLVLGLLGAESYIQQADLVIVGEGRLDSQSANGKAPVGVARMASHYGVPTIALCGGYSEDSRILYQHGITAMWSLCPGPVSLEQAMVNGERYLADTAENLLRTVLSSHSKQIKH